MTFFGHEDEPYVGEIELGKARHANVVTALFVTPDRPPRALPTPEQKVYQDRFIKSVLVPLDEAIAEHHKAAVERAKGNIASAEAHTLAAEHLLRSAGK